MKVNQYWQLTFDDPLCEILIVLHIEGDLTRGGVRKTVRQSV